MTMTEGEAQLLAKAIRKELNRMAIKWVLVLAVLFVGFQVLSSSLELGLQQGRQDRAVSAEQDQQRRELQDLANRRKQ
jgi:hypothetical protein